VGLETVFNRKVSIPNFQFSIPTNRCKVVIEWLLLCRILNYGRVTNTRNPISMIVTFGGKLTFGESIPKFNFSICSRTNNLSVIRGELYGKNFFLVALEKSGGYTLS